MRYSKDITALINSIGMLSLEAGRFFKKFAQLSDEEATKYKDLLDNKVLFKIDEIKEQAGSATKATLEKMSDLSESIGNNEMQMQVLDIDLRAIYSEEYKKVVESGETDETAIREKVAKALAVDKRGYSYSAEARDFYRKKKEKSSLAFENTKLRTEFNKNQASIIISNGIYQKINRRVVDVQTTVPTQGGSKYIEGLLARYRPIVDEMDNIVTALMAANVGGKTAPEAIELAKVFGPEAFSTQFLLRPKTPTKQSAAIPSDLEEITLDEFKQSPVYYVKRDREIKNMLKEDPSLGSFNADGVATLTEAGEEKINQIMERADARYQEVFDDLNRMENTYQKFSTMAKWLDPPAPATYSSAYTLKKGFESVGQPWKSKTSMQAFKLPSGKLSNPDEVRKLISDNLVDTKDRRGTSLERFAIEAQDERNHFVILQALTDMAAESGYPRRTAGQNFLDQIPNDELRNHPLILEKAKELDSIELNKFHLLRDVLIDASANKEIPTWLLMKIIDTFSVIGVTESKAEKEKFRSVNNAVVATATKALEGRGWKPATDENGKLKKQIKAPRNKERQGEVGIVFEKTTPEVTETAATKAKITTANADAVTQLQSQIQNVDKQIAGFQAQIGPLQERKEQLSVQLKGEQERTAQEQQAQQMAQVQNQSTMAPTAPAGPGVTASASKSKYKVIYKK